LSRTTVVVLSAATLLPAVSGCGDLSRDELNRGVESIAAIAAQGQLVANGVARDATKSTYARVMSTGSPTPSTCAARPRSSGSAKATTRSVGW
jgi:hypothetical protein